MAEKPNRWKVIAERGRDIGGLGTAGAAFATVLVIATLAQQTSSSLLALKYFAFSVPLAVSSYVVTCYAPLSSFWWGRLAVEIVGAVGLLVSHIASLFGLYWFFHHISPEAAGYYRGVILWSYIAANVLFGGVIFGEFIGHELKADTGPVAGDLSGSLAKGQPDQK